MSPYTPWHLYLLTYAVSSRAGTNPDPTPNSSVPSSSPTPVVQSCGVSRLTLSRVELAWWFRMHPVPGVRALALEGCEIDENGVSIVAAACQGVIGLVLRRCEVRGGDIGNVAWRIPEPVVGDHAEDEEAAAAAAVAADEDQALVIDAEGLVEDAAVRVRKVAEVEAEADDEAFTTGWWSTGPPASLLAAVQTPSPSIASSTAPASSTSHHHSGLFPNVRLVRFDLCASGCGVDAVRMVLDRCPALERVEFVGCGPAEEALLETVGECSIERAIRAPLQAHGPHGEVLQSESEEEAAAWRGKVEYGNGAGLPWFECKGDVEGCVEDRIRKNERVPLVSVVVEEEEGDVDAEGWPTFGGGGTKVVGVVPEGWKKCIVVQGKGLRRLRDAWMRHLKGRKRELWEGHP
ncbi:hypothetical protein HK101_003735 [Irineochytrium annulatum]|nr:hypothetical protein HK101_003735 [Irineochytrium annulatum]